jgi:hypothetical protein
MPVEASWFPDIGLCHQRHVPQHLGALPVIETTVICQQVEYLPSGATPKPVWLWW